MGGELYDDLVSRIRAGKVIAVVGAGVAIQATGGKPEAGWIGLLRHGVQRIVELGWSPPGRWAERAREALDEAERGEGDTNTLLGVAEAISQYLGAPDNGEWGRWLEETVGSLKATEAGKELLAAIAGLGIPIATTNYDGLLESATGDPPVTWEETGAVVKFLNREQAEILHLHGFWKKPGSVVLGIRDYQRILGAGTAQHVQRVLPSVHSLLYIGCGVGLADPNFAALRQWVGETLVGAHHRHFRLARDGRELQEVRKEHNRDERTFALGYGSAFEHLAPFLRALASAACPGHRAGAPALATAATGPRLFLDEDQDRCGYLKADYASCSIHAPRQRSAAGEPLRVGFSATFGRLKIEGAPRLQRVQLQVELPRRLGADGILGTNLPHRCESGLAVKYAGPSYKAPSWTLSAPEGEDLHDRNAASDDPPLFELAAAQLGEEVVLRLVVFPNQAFFDGPRVPCDERQGEKAQRAREAILKRLRLKLIGETDDEGQITLCTTVNIVEEVTT